MLLRARRGGRSLKMPCISLITGVSCSSPVPRGRMEVHWYTEDEDRLIAEMLAGGASRHEIAARLGRTRNSICGRISRLRRSQGSSTGLPTTPDTATLEAAEDLTAKPTSSLVFPKPSSPLPNLDEQKAMTPTAHHSHSVPQMPSTADATLHLRSSPAAPWSRPTQPATCAFPIDQPGRPKFRFCGAPVEIGHPYCSAHCRISYLRR